VAFSVAFCFFLVCTIGIASTAIATNAIVDNRFIPVSVEREKRGKRRKNREFDAFVFLNFRNYP